MDIEKFRDYCLSLPQAYETTPFDETTLVMKVGGRIFACTDMVTFEGIALKCDPEQVEELTERYAEIGRPSHFNKHHWIAVSVTGSFADDQIEAFIRKSYELVIAGLPRKIRLESGL